MSKRMEKQKIQAHPLAKSQLFIALVWVISIFAIYWLDPKQQNMFMVFIIIPSVLALGLVTTYMGWLAVFRGEVILYPQESFVIQISKMIKGQSFANSLALKYQNVKRRKLLGILNLVTGSLTTIIAVVFLIVS